MLSLRPRPRKAVGAGSVIATGVLYSVTCALLQRGGARPVVRPVLPIPSDRYYRWFTYLTLPTFLAIWLTYAISAHRIAQRLNGAGSAGDTLALTAPALSVPLVVTMWVPETAMALLLVSGRFSWDEMRAWGERQPGLGFHVARQAAGGLWMLALGTVAVREVHRLSASRALLASIAGALPAGALIGITIR